MKKFLFIFPFFLLFSQIFGALNAPFVTKLGLEAYQMKFSAFFYQPSKNFYDFCFFSEKNLKKFEKCEFSRNSSFFLGPEILASYLAAMNGLYNNYLVSASLTELMASHEVSSASLAISQANYELLAGLIDRSAASYLASCEDLAKMAASYDFYEDNWLFDRKLWASLARNELYADYSMLAELLDSFLVSYSSPIELLSSAKSFDFIITDPGAVNKAFDSDLTTALTAIKELRLLASLTNYTAIELASLASNQAYLDLLMEIVDSDINAASLKFVARSYKMRQLYDNFTTEAEKGLIIREELPFEALKQLNNSLASLAKEFKVYSSALAQLEEQISQTVITNMVFSPSIQLTNWTVMIVANSSYVNIMSLINNLASLALAHDTSFYSEANSSSLANLLNAFLFMHKNKLFSGEIDSQMSIFGPAANDPEAIFTVFSSLASYNFSQSFANPSLKYYLPRVYGLFSKELNLAVMESSLKVKNMTNIWYPFPVQASLMPYLIYSAAYFFQPDTYLLSICDLAQNNSSQIADECDRLASYLAKNGLAEIYGYTELVESLYKSYFLAKTMPSLQKAGLASLNNDNIMAYNPSLAPIFDTFSPSFTAKKMLESRTSAAPVSLFIDLASSWYINSTILESLAKNELFDSAKLVNEMLFSFISPKVAYSPIILASSPLTNWTIDHSSPSSSLALAIFNSSLVNLDYIPIHALPKLSLASLKALAISKHLITLTIDRYNYGSSYALSRFQAQLDTFSSFFSSQKIQIVELFQASLTPSSSLAEALVTYISTLRTLQSFMAISICFSGKFELDSAFGIQEIYYKKVDDIFENVKNLLNEVLIDYSKTGKLPDKLTPSLARALAQWAKQLENDKAWAPEEVLNEMKYDLAALYTFFNTLASYEKYGLASSKAPKMTGLFTALRARKDYRPPSSAQSTVPWLNNKRILVPKIPGITFNMKMMNYKQKGASLGSSNTHSSENSQNYETEAYDPPNSNRRILIGCLCGLGVTILGALGFVYWMIRTKKTRKEKKEAQEV